MHWPHAFGSVLVESPALWVAAGRFLLDMEDWEGQLARRIYVGGGTREFSATRGDERPDFDRLLLQYLDRCYDVLVRKVRRERGMRLLLLVRLVL